MQMAHPSCQHTALVNIFHGLIHKTLKSRNHEHQLSMNRNSIWTGRKLALMHDGIGAGDKGRLLLGEGGKGE